jgi:predicted dehydrogenase
MIQAGAGLWGASWAKVIAASPHWDLVALADPDEEALSRSGRALGIAAAACFTSLRAAIEQTESDAVLVAAPPPAHGPLALEALEGGLHCLVEKPLAPSIGEARSLVKRADECGQVLMASQNYRFRAAYRTVQNLLRSGELGRVGAVQIDFRQTPLFTGFRLEMDDPLLVDQGVHHLDQARGLLASEPTEVRALGFNPPWSPFTGDASALVDVVFEDGAVLSYSGTWAPRGSETGWDGTWLVQCERGAIQWSESAVRIFPADPPPRGRIARRLRAPGARVPLIGLEETDRAGVLAELASAIASEREPETSGRDNLGTLELVFGAVESARTGRPVHLPLQR